MALNDAMKNRLVGIRRSYLTLAEYLSDPDVISNDNLLGLGTVLHDLAEDVGVGDG